MSEIELKNALIESVTITNDDHGCLTMFLHLSYGGSGQGFGGYVLYVKGRSEKDYTGHFIWRCLEIADVTTVSDLPGCALRVRASHEKVHAIGHLLKEDWFYPSEELK